VLLLCVALLQMLALMGVAWLITARLDRHGSTHNVANTQVDLLMDGLRSMALGVVCDAPLEQQYVDPFTDTWQASRLPEVSGSTPQWPFLSAPLHNGGVFTSPLLDASGTLLTSASRTGVKVTSLMLDGRAWPAVEIDGKVLLAADTDGDGIADAGLWPLPIGAINGVTYYAAVRIIDNNSALNAAVAWKRNDETVHKKDLAGNFFPTNVDLQSLLSGGSAEMDVLNRYRFAHPSAKVNLSPLDDSGTQRKDFDFVLPYDAVWMQLGRRLANPGYNQPNRKYRALAAGDTVALASGFIRRNPTLSSSNLENLLSTSLLGPSVPVAAFAPDAIASWSALFNHESSDFSRRCLLVSSNPVTNQIAPRSVSGSGNPTPGHSDMAGYDSAPAKTSINTAPFAELWRAFWCVMAKPRATGGFDTPFGSLGSDQFNPYLPAHPQRMFKSSLREMRFDDVTRYSADTIRFAPDQQLLLRAALAAVNAMDLRDPDRVPTVQSINLKAFVPDAASGAAALRDVQVKIFGAEPRPFITEVYVHTDTVSQPSGARGPNPHGYIAIELFNPYPFDIALNSAYQIATLDRRPASTTPPPPDPYPNMRLEALLGFADSAAPVVPARGYLVLENHDPSDAAAAAYRPASSGLPLRGAPPAPGKGLPPRNFQYVPGLERALDRELVLLCRTSSGSNALADMAPVDQFDFTGISLPQAPPYAVLHYVRPHDAGARRFACIYPGRYDGTKRSARHEGTQQDNFDLAVGLVEPALAVPAQLGAPDPAGSYANPFLPIQWCDLDTPGPNPLTDDKKNLFPFGGFARLGDMLHVPYIGSYTVSLPGGAGGNILECNAATTDCAFADDGDPIDDAVENVGRFCPTFIAGSGGSGPPGSGGGFDPSKANPLVRQKLTMKYYTPGDYVVRNEVRGEMLATVQNSLKGFQISIFPGVIGSVSFINCQSRDITREPCPPSPQPVHTDGFWVAGRTGTTALNVNWIDCDVRRIEGVPYLWEFGSAKRLYFKNSAADWKFEFKLMPGCVIDEIVFDGCSGQVSFAQRGGRANRLYINNHQGWRPPASIKDVGQIILGLPPDLSGGNPPQTGGEDYYAWAADLFEYFSTIAVPHHDFLPHHGQAGWVDPAKARSGSFAPPPQPVPNTAGLTAANANGPGENAVGIEGLVNINTASWKVLSCLPMLDDLAENQNLAKAIVAYRAANGPFKTFFDLYKVPEFKAASDAVTADGSSDPDDEDGDISPKGQGNTDGVRKDFEERFLLLNRISNLVTLRSDSFTCYLMIQGWRGAGTSSPQLVAQRRAGLIVDRSGLTPTQTQPRVTHFVVE